MSQTITIHFIRNPAFSSGTDDITTIRRRGSRDDYLIRFVDGTQDNSVWVQTKTFLETVGHIERMLRFLLIDADPYSHTQVTVPGLPIILVANSALNEEVVDDIVKSISSHMDSHTNLFAVLTPERHSYD